jgi:hypothetical protein
MNHHRPSYRQFKHYQDFAYYPPYFYQNQKAPTQQQSGIPPAEEQPFYSNPIPPTPYEKFAKPKQPPYTHNYSSNYGYGFMQQQGVPNPGFPPQPWNQPNGIISYFQDENGQIDIDKMLSTFGQVADTVKQVSPLVKGLGSIMKGK